MHLVILSLGTEIDVGFVTKTTLKCLITSGDIPSSKEQVFLNGAYAFFQKAYEYALSHLPIDDPVLSLSDLKIERAHLYPCHNILLKGNTNFIISQNSIHRNVHPFPVQLFP